MTPTELRAALEADGWRFGVDTLHNTGVPWHAWKRVWALADCTCNDKPPALMLRPYALVNGREWYSVEFSVCGEAAGDWLDLRFYSVPMDQAITKIPRAIELLGAAWNAAAATGGV